MRTFISFLVLLCVAQPRFAHAGDTDGEKLAQEICTTCHIVRRGQDVQPVYDDTLPSFEQIANRQYFSRPWLHDFLQNRHASRSNPAGMPDLRLQPRQIDDVFDFIVTLRKR